MKRLRNLCTGRRPVHAFRKLGGAAAALIAVAAPLSSAHGATTMVAAASSQPAAGQSVADFYRARNNATLWLAPSAGNAARTFGRPSRLSPPFWTIWIVDSPGVGVGSSPSRSRFGSARGSPVATAVVSCVAHGIAPAIASADVAQMRTNYPMVHIRGFSGTVRLQFVIDTAGRAVPSTVHDVWPANEPALAGPQRFAYDSVVRVMRLALAGARFAPAHIGGCPVSQLVQQAFTYRPVR